MYTTLGNVHNFLTSTQFLVVYIIFGNVYNFWKCTQFFRNVHNFWICTRFLGNVQNFLISFFLFRLQKFYFKSQRSELSAAGLASATKGSTHPTGQLTQLICKITTLSQCQVKKKTCIIVFFNATFKFKCKMSLPKVGIILWVSFSSARCKMHLLALKRASAAALPFFALTSQQQQQRVVEEWC